MGFDGSPWHGDISNLRLKPLCAVAMLDASNANDPQHVLATVSSLPELVASFGATLPEILSDISGGELTISPVVVSLGSFLNEKRDIENFHLMSYTLIKSETEETYRALGKSRLFLDDLNFWATKDEALLASDRTLPNPVEARQRLLETLDQNEPWPIAEGLSSIEFALKDSNYRVQRDGVVRLSSRYASPEQVYTDLSQLVLLTSEYIHRAPNHDQNRV